ncbi:MAG: TlpA family protein disulfide reductase [Myxococcales bacterium]|nr:TlpA family protein disulfide reductase [Myxococcales bacterium]
MTVDDSRGKATTSANDLTPNKTAGGKPGGAGVMVDPRSLLVGGGVALVGVVVLGLFLWMVPNAAARERKAACRGLKDLGTLVDSPLCPNGGTCALPVAAPEFTAKDITGKDVKLSDFRGKVVLLNFWASWCGVCKTEKPGLSAMATDMASKDFVVLALSSDHSWAEPLASLLSVFAPAAVPPGKPEMEKVGAAYRQALPNGTPFKVLIDPPDGDDNIGKITTSWGIKAVPESALIDRDGNIRAYFVNKRDWHSPVAQTCLRSVIDGD